MFLFLKYCFLVLFSHLFTNCSGQDGNLTAVFLDPLPHNLLSAAAHYDGQDSIYLFGGERQNHGGYLRTIFRFDISTSNVSQIGSLPSSFAPGVVEADSFRNIYVLGTGTYANNIYKYNPEENQSEYKGQTPYSVQFSTSVKHNDKAIIFGGYGGRYDIMSYDLETSTYTPIMEKLPFWIISPVAIKVGNKALIFGPPATSFLSVDLDTFEITSFLSTVPVKDYDTAGIYDGKNVYFIGGVSGANSKGIIRFDPVTHQWGLVHVNNYPLTSGNTVFIRPPSMVYVEKVNRIYLFGGFSWHSPSNTYSHWNDIWYIDLTPTSATSTGNA